MASNAGRADRRPGRLSRTHSLSRVLLTLALSTLVAVPTALAAAVPAQAQQTSAEVRQQLDKAWRELEPIIEEHNGIRTELRKRQKEADKLAERIEPLQLQLDLARAEVKDVAVRSFMGGNVSAFKALLTTGSPMTFADQLTVLDMFARAQQEKIEKVVQAKERYEAQKAELDALVAELSRTEAELAEKAEKIDAEIDRLQALHDELRAQEIAATGPADTGNGGACPASSPGGAAGIAIAFACAQMGKPYGWGQAGPSAYDCSGLTMAAWAQAGVSLPHNAAQQRNVIPYIERSALRPGDLVFYYSDLSHVAMYAGGGYIVHAPRAGVPVSLAPIDQMPIHSYGRPG